MTTNKMPDEIWAERRPKSRSQIYDHRYGSWNEETDGIGIRVKYIRSDIHDKLIDGIENILGCELFMTPYQIAKELKKLLQKEGIE